MPISKLRANMSTPENTDTPATTVANSNSQAESTPPAIDWEKRFKDTQADYTRKSQENAKLRAELELLRQAPQIPAEVQAELDDLKYRDPDAWKARLDSIAEDHRKLYDAKLSEITGELTAKEQRKLELDDYMANNPGFYIDDDVIANDLPRRLSLKLEKGEISFTDFLKEAHEYLVTPKVIGNTTVGKKPNLDKVGGDHTPTSNATNAAIKTSYKNEVY